MSGINGGVRESIGDASTVLLVAPPDSRTDETGCTELLTRPGPPHPDVVCVTLNGGPDERLDAWHRHVGEQLPNRVAIVDAREDGGGRGAAVAASPTAPVELDALDADAALLDLAVAVAARVGGLADGGGRTRLCLHSVDALIDRYSVQCVVDFVGALNALCDGLDVVAHHHVNPEECPESVLATLRPLYDAVVEGDGDGWTVSSAAEATAGPSFRRTLEDRPGPASRRVGPSDVAPLPYSFDTVLELVRDPVRRDLLYELTDRPDGEIPFDELVEAVEERARTGRDGEREPDSERIALQLLHAHLPKLAERNVIRFDRETETVTYRRNPALDTHLEWLRALERGVDPPCG